MLSYFWSTKLIQKNVVPNVPKTKSGRKMLYAVVKTQDLWKKKKQADYQEV